MNRQPLDRGQRGPRPDYVNDKIKAPTIMVLDAAGQKIGTFPRAKALAMAEEAEKDLVQIGYNPNDMVSTVKLIDYGKYKYKKQKEEKEKKKQQKAKGLKELKMKYSTGDNEVGMKLEKATELLKEGYNVKIIIRLRGREKIYANKARDKLQTIQEELSAVGKTQYPTPKAEGNGYSIILFSKGS